MKKILHLISISVSISVLILLVGGCIIKPGGVAASTMPLTAEDNYIVVQKNVTGISGCFAPLGIELWPVSGYRALQDAKNTNNCDGLINAQVNTLDVLFLYRQYEVQGDAVRIIKKTVRVQD